MNDLTGWTYGTYPSFPEWLAPRLAPSSDAQIPHIPLSSDESQSLIDYFSGKLPVIEAAQALISFSYGERPLSELTDLEGLEGVAQRCYQHVCTLTYIISDLPALHPQIVDLVKTANNLRDDQLGLTEAQMSRVDSWRRDLRLEDFASEARDAYEGYFVHENAYHACHSQRYEWDWAYMGKWHIDETLGRTEPVIAALFREEFDAYVWGACYWLARAGPLLYERSKANDEFMGISMVVWRDWKQRLRSLVDETEKMRDKNSYVSDVKVSEETIDMCGIALRRMTETEQLKGAK